jgi:AcrR family transcriptional regulator
LAWAGGLVNNRDEVNGKRLTREQWLDHALRALARRGGAKLRIQDLVRSVGVTTGSFYWHFTGRDDFVTSVVDYWMSEYTGRVIEHVEAVGANPQRRLRALMQYLLEKDPARYDLPVRNWAAQEASVGRRVRRVDRQRLRFVRSVFADLGFRGAELEMRTRIFVVYYSLDGVLTARPNRKQRLREFERQYAFFARR